MNIIINEIKTHEKRYTIILVSIFVLLIIYISTCAFAISNKVVNDNIKYRYSAIMPSYQNITIDKEHKKYTIDIVNTKNETIRYKILLQKDNNIKDNFDMSNIKYSVDGHTKNLVNNVISEGELSANMTISVDIGIWLENSSDQFKGYFKIIK